MKFLIVFAVVTASLGMATFAHAECPLIMQKRLLLSDKTPPPDIAQDSSNNASKDAAAVGKAH